MVSVVVVVVGGRGGGVSFPAAAAFFFLLRFLIHVLAPIIPFNNMILHVSKC